MIRKLTPNLLYNYSFAFLDAYWPLQINLSDRSSVKKLVVSEPLPILGALVWRDEFVLKIGKYFKIIELYFWITVQRRNLSRYNSFIMEL